MGKIEEGIKKEIRRTKIQQAILGTLAVAGMLSVIAVAPNAIQILGCLNLSGKRKRNTYRSISRSRTRLLENGLIQWSKNRRGFIEITEKGRNYLRRAELFNYKIPKPKRWDKKWRILTFDIPEKRRIDRTRIRKVLHSMGFVRLQDSVWVYPHDCEDFITLLKANFMIGHALLYVVADAIENDRWLLEEFGLKR